MSPASDEPFDAARVGRWFDRLADAHDRFTLAGHRRPVDVWVAQQVERLLAQRPARVADLGGGSGTLAELASRAGADVVLVDCSARMGTLARRRLAGCGPGRVEVVTADVVEYLLGARRTFDVVFAVGELVAYVPSPLRLLSAVARRTAGTGVLLMTYMERAELLSRAAPGDVVVDRGAESIVVERRDERLGDLQARAFSDARMRTLLRAGGWRPTAAGPAGSPRQGLLARPRGAS